MIYFQLETTEPHTTMPLEINIKKNPGTLEAGAVTITLAGSLDTSTAPALEQKITPILNSEVKDLVFDLVGLKFISSAGLRVFSIARKKLKERGGQAGFINLQPQIEEVFEIMKALPGIAVFQSEAEMDQYLAARQKSYEGS